MEERLERLVVLLSKSHLVIDRLMAVIEKSDPQYYYSSDLIAKGDDLCKEIEREVNGNAEEDKISGIDNYINQQENAELSSLFMKISDILGDKTIQSEVEIDKGLIDIRYENDNDDRVIIKGLLKAELDRVWHAKCLLKDIINYIEVYGYDEGSAFNFKIGLKPGIYLKRLKELGIFKDDFTRTDLIGLFDWLEDNKKYTKIALKQIWDGKYGI